MKTKNKYIKQRKALLAAVLVVLSIFFAFAPVASAAGHAVVSISTDAGAEHGATTTVPIIADDDGSNMCLGECTINVTFDPGVVHVTKVATGSGNALAVVASNIQNGWVKIVSVDGSAAHNGTVTLANVTFEAVGYPPDTSPLNITVETLTDWYDYSQIAHTVSNGTFTVTGLIAPIELFDETGKFKGSFKKIQDAVNNASNGYTILVHDGTYNENVDVNMVNLTIQSENGFASTTVQASNPNDHVFAVTADYVNLSGFMVTGATGSEKAGIYLGRRVNHCNISNNNASNNEYGIYLSESSNNTLSNNIANSNGNYGIHLYSSSNNTIYNNYFNNTNNAYDDGTNIWNIAKTPGKNIIDGLYLGGNYWRDYAGDDLDGDGLGDTRLPSNSSGNIQKGGDYLPLVKPVATSVFDTGKGTYPSIMGAHEGEITPNKTIIVHKMYTYPCIGTGGHTEYVRFYGENDLDVTKTWNGYIGEYHYIIFDPPITLHANRSYNYEIRTGSYPQIIHEQSRPTPNGTINCTQFTDVNGRTYNNWIPAIRLE